MANTPLPEAQAFAQNNNLDKLYFYQQYPRLRRENSPQYGVDAPQQVALYSLSYDELCYLLSAEGAHLILFGGPWCANTMAVIDRINYYARQYGVEAVYHFDFRFDGASRRTSIREDVVAQPGYPGPDKAETPLEGAQFNYQYGELVRHFLTNLNDWVQNKEGSEKDILWLDRFEDIQRSANVQVPFLFLYNKNNRIDHSGKTSQPNAAGCYPIVYAFEAMCFAGEGGALYSSPEVQNDATLVADYDERLQNAIFRHIGEPGLELTPYTHSDYMRQAYSRNTRGHAFKTEDAFSPTEPINIRMVNYAQLRWLLNQPGAWLLLFGGAWCANTQGAIATINDYAVANGATVYMFDTRIDGKYPIDFWKYPRRRELQIRDDRNLLKQYYIDMIEQHFANIVTSMDSPHDPPIIQYTDEAGRLHRVGRLQAPHFLAYDRDAVDAAGKPAQILAYCEKMYELVNCKPCFIYSAENYRDYRQGAFGVLKAYCQRLGLPAKELTRDRTAPVVPGEPTRHVETEDHHKEHDWSRGRLTELQP